MRKLSNEELSRIFCDTLADEGERDKLYIIAQERFNTGDMEGAFDYFKRVVEVDPTFGEAHDAMGIIQYEAGDHEGAKQSLEKAIEHGFQNGRSVRSKTYLYLGAAYFNSDHYASAEACLKKAVSLDDWCVDGYKSLLVLYLNNENHTAANECFKKLDELEESMEGMGYYKALAKQKAMPEFKLYIMGE